ncbi:MAG: uL15 family ribosomal protein, partial [Wenzhouxiangellaceae bacterium]
TDHAILRRSGFTVQSPRSPWKIRDKITAVNTGTLERAVTVRGLAATAGAIAAIEAAGGKVE